MRLRILAFLSLITLVSVAGASTLSAQSFLRGDGNGSGMVDIADAVFVLDYLFQSEPAECLDAIDTNDDGGIDIADGIALLDTLFGSGSIPAPFPSCGPDPTVDTLGCASSGSCVEPPTDLVYLVPMASYVVGTPIVPNSPTSSGGPVDLYTVSPLLPAGLTLDPVTGVISGTPIVASSMTDYAIVAQNSGGSAFTIVSIAVNVGAPELAANQFYEGPSLQTHRYGHTATTLADGRVLICGGSDENFLSSLDTCELFDQTLTATPVPDSLSGEFIDTDFAGDPIVMQQGSSVFHTATKLADGTVLLCGGTTDILGAETVDVASRFDPLTRTFTTIGALQASRFRHTATAMADGTVLIVGGQRAVVETIIDPNFPPGSPFFQFEITTFPSTNDIEKFNPLTNTFSTVRAELSTPRGRTSHTSTVIAGFDNTLGTADDLVITSGGVQTLGSIFAPQNKGPGAAGAALVHSAEFIDPALGFAGVLPGIDLDGRVRGSIVNLGDLGTTTWDGVDGLGNVLLAFGGDLDSPTCEMGVSSSELLVMTFSGFGPSSGLSAVAVSPDTAQQGAESALCSAGTGRALAGGVLLPNRRVRNGIASDGAWLFTAGGVTSIGPPDPINPCAVVDLVGCGDVVRGGSFFDPQYNAALAQPWDLDATRSPSNPTGVAGSWLTTDGAIPDDSLEGYGDGSPVVTLNAGRLLHTMSAIPGLDGVLGTADDRVLIVGGGDSWWSILGGSPVAISSEIYVPPTAAP